MQWIVQLETVISKLSNKNRSEGCTTLAMDLASMNGYLQIVEYLHLNRSEGCYDALFYATKYCHFEIVKYLVENGIGLDRLREAIYAEMESDDDQKEEFLKITQYLAQRFLSFKNVSLLELVQMECLFREMFKFSAVCDSFLIAGQISFIQIWQIRCCSILALE